MPKKKAAAALQYLDPSFFEHSPKHRAELEEARVAQDLARALYDLRVASGKSLKELARAAGMTAKSLEKLEKGEHARPTLALLRQVASPLGKRIELKIVGAQSRRAPAKGAAGQKPRYV